MLARIEIREDPDPICPVCLIVFIDGMDSSTNAQLLLSQKFNVQSGI